MKSVWALGRGTVKQVHRDLASRRPLAYTTVLTVLDRLHRKGVVRRERMERLTFTALPILRRMPARLPWKDW